MEKITFNRTTLLVAFTMLVAGLLIGWLAKPSAASGASHEDIAMDAPASAAATIWTCSMDPQIRQSEPGKCPICGMDLIPLDDDISSDAGSMEIKMSPTAMQLANVQTAIVGYGKPTREVRMNGKVQPDERRIFSQVTHLDGRVEQLTINFTGEPVRKGQVLASLYAPELVTAQEELFAALKIKDMQPALFQAAREKLKNWKLTDGQIDKIITAGKPQERFPILADVSGIVMQKKVNLGDYLMRGMPLYDIVDLSRVWVLFDIYESDMSWAKVGSTVEFTIQSLPGEQFTGKISFIDPVINPVTRVATARVEIPNPGGKFKPEMFASGVIKTPLSNQKESMMVPKSAVLWTGERSVVYVKETTEQGVHFWMQEVTLGPLVGDHYVITKGLDPGMEIAIQGTFSIDAAAQLAGKPSMMSPSGGSAGSMASMDVSKEAKLAVQQLFEPYFLLKDALVKDDLATAQKHGRELKKVFEKTSMNLFTGKAHDHWMSHSGAGLNALNKLLAAKDIEGARTAFKPLSDQMVGLAKAFGPFDETVYVQHCPMADSNTGADWLSLDKKIQNPYFGDKMLTCGSVTATIR
ncbi:MAG: efflux RND transporter periplasmic adaptor subunit [Lewinellaceae bacterium]|nr:efflux RND transporter periplasmic adaptor subunit [Lewinellaceae bacterium]